MANTTVLDHVCLGINLDAFILNEKVCEGPTLIAPITQPNYVSLRLSNSQIQHDILPRIDLHNTQPALANPRVSKTFSEDFHALTPSDPAPNPQNLVAIDRSRLGVYLHWSIPKGYRSASSQASPPPPSKGKSTTTSKTDPNANPNPVFPLVPNRWLVVRILRKYSPAQANVDRATAWVVESDRLQNIEDLDQSIDLETDVTPFVAYSGDSDNPDLLNNQAEKYIGHKQSLSGWTEPTTPGQPRPLKLTTMNSSNPLFADYAIHNPNVFSTKDNFAYTDGNNNTMYLDSAECDYIVVGWHADMDEDPLHVVKGSENAQDLLSRLQRFFCAPQPNADGKPDEQTTDLSNKNRKASMDSTRLFCHAAKYSVSFDLTVRPTVAGDRYANLFPGKTETSPTPNDGKIDMEPVAVGTTPLDAVLAFFQAHEQDPDLENTVFGTGTGGSGGSTGSDIAATLMAIRELLYATEDDYDSRVKAADLIFAHNFGRAPGGFIWQYDKQKDKTKPAPPAAPSTTPDKDGKSEVDYLADLNDTQSIRDAAERKLAQLSWALFSEFFKFVSDPSNGSLDLPDQMQGVTVEPVTNISSLYAERIPNLRKEAMALQQIMRDAENHIATLQTKVLAKKVADDPFFQRTDPTLCLAGIDSGWDSQYLGITPTRFQGKDCTLAEPTSPKESDVINPILDLIKKQMRPDLVETLTAIVREASGGMQNQLQQFGHKTWTEQPFSPQFVEWEGIFYNIDFPDHWGLDFVQSALASSNQRQLTYSPTTKLSDLSDRTVDVRSVTGRMLVLPQPSFALGAVVAQVITGTPIADLPGWDPKKPPPSQHLKYNLQDPTDQASFIADAKNLKFISGEMTGLTDALLTRAVGHHVKPNVREQGTAPIPMGAAVTMGNKITMQNGDFGIIGGETGPTPFGTLTDFTQLVNEKKLPFKALTHGQFAITRITIVDKFAQVVSVPPAKRPLRNPTDGTPDFIHPCLSEQLIPSLLSDNQTLNTIYTPKETQDASTKSGYKMTPFIQLTPAINQNARINASFLEQTTDKNKNSLWQSCSDWESPIFGWIIVNYADSSLQFFTGEGVFYTSMRFGGPKGTIQAKDWAPFDPPSASSTPVSDQLVNLIKMMSVTGNSGKNYLSAMWDMIERAIQTMPFPPSDYAQYANAIVGKPLALVNVGWSLELAQPAYWRQYTLPPPPHVVPKPGQKLEDTIDPLRTEAEDFLTSQEFHVKIGDAERPYDGVVGYWDSTNPSVTTDFSHIYTYFLDPKNDDGIRVNINVDATNAPYPVLKPYFLPPEDAQRQGVDFTRASVEKMKVKTLLIDPYTPIHLYSGILPTKSLQLPAWTMQKPMANMSAFFTLGPVLITKDVPKVYDWNNPLHPDSWLQNQTTQAKKNVDPLINLPIAGSKGLWNWLQPYYGPLETPPSTTTPSTSSATEMNKATAVTPVPKNVTRYNPLEVGKEDGTMRNDPAPYTFVEGYLQLAKPLIQSQSMGT